MEFIVQFTFEDLYNINFPVFGLKGELRREDGLIYIDEGLVDDLNQQGTTLGNRRMQTPHKLRILQGHCPGVAEMLISNYNTFIDNYGFIFRYHKTKNTKVVYHKILEVINKNYYSVLKLDYTNFPVVVKRPPPVGMGWVGMLYYDKTTPWVPYEYSEVRCATKRRKF